MMRRFAMYSGDVVDVDLSFYLQRPVPLIVRNIIFDIVSNVRKYKTNTEKFNDWRELSRHFGVDDSVVRKVRDENLLKYYSAADDGMKELAKAAGADDGLMNTYWYTLVVGNVELTFTDQADRFCFSAGIPGSPPLVHSLGCVGDISLEDALVILYNLAKIGI